VQLLLEDTKLAVNSKITVTVRGTLGSQTLSRGAQRVELHKRKPALPLNTSLGKISKCNRQCHKIKFQVLFSLFSTFKGGNKR
jgi:hypothetical protein